MPRADVDGLYARYIKPSTAEDRLRLLAMIAHDLASVTTPKQPRERSLLELEELGPEIWQGMDAQAYVHELREEWDQRP